MLGMLQGVDVYCLDMHVVFWRFFALNGCVCFCKGVIVLSFFYNQSDKNSTPLQTSFKFYPDQEPNQHVQVYCFP